jgi:hypothetical protein
MLGDSAGDVRGKLKSEKEQETAQVVAKDHKRATVAQGGSPTTLHSSESRGRKGTSTYLKFAMFMCDGKYP